MLQRKKDDDEVPSKVLLP